MDVQSLLEGVGPWALVVIAVLVFIESGLLFPFLPGDSLLVTAGLVHERLALAVPVIALVAFLAAAAGDQVGYLLGDRFGARLFTEDARVLKTSRLRETEAFFARYGGRALVLGRFVPVVRTYVPLAAGSARFPYRRFLPWNLLGAFLWAVGVTVVGSLLGGVPVITDNIDVLLTVVVLVSVLPVVVGQLRKRAKARRAAERASPQVAGVPRRTGGSRRPCTVISRASWNRRITPHAVTRRSASATMPLLIFDRPSTRSVRRSAPPPRRGRRRAPSTPGRPGSSSPARSPRSIRCCG